MNGNMLSRWTDFLRSDGEKEWRNRDDEFVDTTGTDSATSIIHYYGREEHFRLESSTEIETSFLQKYI